MPDTIRLAQIGRVEGHGKVTVRRRGEDIEGVSLDFFETPRMFDRLLTGRHYSDLPTMSSRICSICSAVHRVTACDAIESAFGTILPDKVVLLRRLLLAGERIQSHALHLYFLVLPDLERVPDVPSLHRAQPQAVDRGLRLRQAGMTIQEAVGGRTIHPMNVVPGGFGRDLAADDLHRLRKTAEDALPLALETFRIFNRTWPEAPLGQHVEVMSGHGAIRGGGATVAFADYRKILQEKKKNGGEGGAAVTVGGKPPVTGAAARLRLDPPRSGEAGSCLRRATMCGDIRDNIIAQAVEIVAAVEEALELLDVLERATGEECRVRVVPRQGAGTALREAPRGTLAHSYSVAEDGTCTAARVMTPTAINRLAAQCDAGTTALAGRHLSDDDLRMEMERVVRLYDPCISCAVHILRR